jgi:hypothetical protein
MPGHQLDRFGRRHAERLADRHGRGDVALVQLVATRSTSITSIRK